MKLGGSKPSDSYEVVIVAEDENGQIVVLEDEEYPGEEAVYLTWNHDRDPEIQELVAAFRKAWGPSARAMRTEEFALLADVRDVADACEVEADIAGLPDDLGAWADGAEFTEDD
jgi:hypothetical protein